MTAFNRLVFPAPLAPTNATVSPYPHRQIHPKQRLRRPVVHGEVGDVE